MYRNFASALHTRTILTLAALMLLSACASNEQTAWQGIQYSQASPQVANVDYIGP